MYIYLPQGPQHNMV